mgnify:CR=1 FL=1|jgi:hypothetical protein
MIPIFPIIVPEPITWNKVEVPYEIVSFCKDYTWVDPYKEDNNNVDELKLLDCYWHKMGYYGNEDSYYSVFHSLSMPNTVFPNVNCPVPYTILSNFNGFEVNP